MNSGRVLVLDGHTNQALACVRALGRAGYWVALASHRAMPLGGWSVFCRRRFRLPGETRNAFAALREWAQDLGITVVLPLTERACLLCSADRSSWESSGITVGCGPEEMLMRAFDKAQTLRAATASDIRIPATVMKTSLREYRLAAADIRFPCVVKARFSNAWDGTTFHPGRAPSYVRSPAELDSAVLGHRQGPHWPLLQEFVPGGGKGVFALCDRGRAVAWFAHERLRDVQPSGSRSCLRRAVRLEERIQQPAARLLREMQWHGPVMVEFRDDGRRPPCLMEVNGRFWGSLQLSIDAGLDFPALWLAILEGRAVPTTTAYEDGVTLRWLWGDFKRFLCVLRGKPRGYPGAYPTRIEGLRELLGPQPAGTRSETWEKGDPWPALGEWVQGLDEVLAHGRGILTSARTPHRRPPRRSVRSLVGKRLVALTGGRMGQDESSPATMLEPGSRGC